MARSQHWYGGIGISAIIGLITILAVCDCSTSFADTVYLTDGKMIQGKVKASTDDKIVFEYERGKFKAIPRTDIQKIQILPFEWPTPDAPGAKPKAEPPDGQAAEKPPNLSPADFAKIENLVRKAAHAYMARANLGGTGETRGTVVRTMMAVREGVILSWSGNRFVLVSTVGFSWVRGQEEAIPLTATFSIMLTSPMSVDEGKLPKGTILTRGEDGKWSIDRLGKQ